jgi:hypothetical protein
MKHKLFAAIVLTASAAFGQVSFGIQIGPPPPPHVLRVRPAIPAPGYAWVDGYWYPVNNRYLWHQGYWTRPPYPEAVWVGPRYEGRQFFEGYWSGPQPMRHSHGWDRDQYRDYNHGNRGKGKGKGR